jgi:hypothetical protein
VEAEGVSRRACVLALGLGALVSVGDAAAQLRYLGQQIVPTGHRHESTEVGGLSGLDFDAERGLFYAISDDRSREARFYTLTLDLSKFNRQIGPGMAGVRFAGVHHLLDRDGKRFEGRSVDPEAIRLHPQAKTLLWSSEGDPRKDIAPFLREMTLAAEPRRDFALPPQFLGTPGRARGVRNNLAFESLALTPTGKRMLAATENALAQDGPQSSRRSGSACRVLVIDHASGAVVAQHVYAVDAVVAPSLLPNGLETNGLSELLAVDEDLFIAVERSYSAGSRLSIRLYLTRAAGATDVSALDALQGATYRSMEKTLLLDLDQLTNDDGTQLWLDNIEAISFGPRLPNGNRTLILLSDNNFQNSQQTQFLAFEITHPLLGKH